MDQLELIIDFGSEYCTRYQNDIAGQEEYFLAEIADEMRLIVLKALKEHEPGRECKFD